MIVLAALKIYQHFPRPPESVLDQVSGGTFRKVLPEDSPVEEKSPFHVDIPPPMPYTNCPKQYISGNITRKLPIGRQQVKVLLCSFVCELLIVLNIDCSFNGKVSVGIGGTVHCPRQHEPFAH